MKKLLCLLACCSYLTGCGLYSYPNTPEKVMAKTTTNTDPFNKITKTKFPWINYQKLPNDEICEMIGKSKWGLIPAVSYRIIAVETEQEGSRSYVLKSSQTRPHWAFYRSIFDSEGTQLDMHVKREINSNGTITEHFTIKLPEDYLISHRNKNVAYKIYGDKDTILFHIQGNYFDGVLKYFGK